MRTKLAGDIVIGPYYSGQQGEILLSCLKPRLFIYNVLAFGPANVFGTYSPEASDESVFTSFQTPAPSQHDHNDFDQLSSAPLKDVTRISVFNDKKLGSCRAIMFDYQNGARRAVGNCRLGVDRVETYLDPTRICYRPILPRREHSRALDSQSSSLVDRREVLVESGCDSTHQHEEAGWVCSAMEGDLEFQFSQVESIIRILAGTEGQPT